MGSANCSLLASLWEESLGPWVGTNGREPCFGEGRNLLRRAVNGALVGLWAAAETLIVSLSVELSVCLAVTHPHTCVRHLVYMCRSYLSNVYIVMFLH